MGEDNQGTEPDQGSVDPFEVEPPDLTEINEGAEPSDIESMDNGD